VLRDYVAEPLGFGARHALQEVVVPAREGGVCLGGGGGGGEGGGGGVKSQPLLRGGGGIHTSQRTRGAQRKREEGYNKNQEGR